MSEMKQIAISSLSHSLIFHAQSCLIQNNLDGIPACTGQTETSLLHEEDTTFE